MNGSEIKEMLPFLVPLIVVALGLLVIALVDLARRERVAGGSKLVWVLIVILVDMIGPVVYLAFGRREAYVERDTD
jgi:hypothetical protein